MNNLSLKKSILKYIFILKIQIKRAKVKESFFKLRCKLYITKRAPALIGDFRVPATSHSRPAG
jgi:hypothetical protein